MKQIIAIVRPFQAEGILEALQTSPVEAYTVRELKGFGRQKNYLQDYSDSPSEFSRAYLPKVEIDVWVEAYRAEEVIQMIVEIARTGRMGDGKIFVLPAAIG